MRRAIPTAALCAVLLLGACVQHGRTYVPSTRSAVELRMMQTRVIEAPQDDVMRGVIATMHDLGYRITRVAPEAGTISGTRQSALRLAAVVQPRDDGTTAVRANASIISPQVEAQVDSAEFYLKNFFVPLGDTMHRDLRSVSEQDSTPEAARPVAEINSQAEREAAAAKAPE